MEKEFKMSEQPLSSKIIYTIVVCILVASTIVIALVAANDRKNPVPATPDVSDVTKNPPEEEKPESTVPKNPPEEEQPETTHTPTFLSPTVGSVMTGHSTEVPVFSDTLNAWRMHTGIDIATEENAAVYASADGEITAVYQDPMYGTTVEITHTGSYKTRYANLKTDLPSGIAVGKKVFAGDRIGTVGDTALCELAEEPHLHFSLLLNDVSVNPLDYLDETAKRVSLQITQEPTI